MNAQTTLPAEMLTLYAKAPDELEAVLSGITETQFNKCLTPETWSIRQIVHHMVDGDAMWTLLMKVAIFNSSCSFDFGWYKSNDTSADGLLYTKRSVEPVVQLFRANRTQMMQLFTLLGDAGNRYIQLTTSEGSDTIKLSEMVAIQASHAMGHIGEIQAIHRSLQKGAYSHGHNHR